MGRREAWRRGCLGDDLPALERAAGEALEQADLVVVTGGASVGEKDFAKAMFAAARARADLLEGRDQAGQAGLARPGAAAGSSSACPAIRPRRWSPPGCCSPRSSPASPGAAGRCEWRPVPLAGPLPACDERETFHRARLAGQRAVPLANQDSGAQKALAEADLLLRSRPGDPARETGEEVEALDF